MAGLVVVGALLTLAGFLLFQWVEHRLGDKEEDGPHHKGKGVNTGYHAVGSGADEERALQYAPPSFASNSREISLPTAAGSADDLIFTGI
jgi:hypothetical protein